MTQANEMAAAVLRALGGVHCIGYADFKRLWDQTNGGGAPRATADVASPAGPSDLES